MSQKGYPYIKLFTALSRVRLVFCILSQLDILCSSVVKPHYSKMTIHQYSPLTRYSHFTCSPTYCSTLKWIDPYIKRSVLYKE